MKKIFAEEELEESSEEESEEPLLPENAVEEHSRPELEDGANSDEELPEVFTMTEGKSMAEQLRSEERASEQRIAAEVKKVKEARAAARKSKTSSRTVSLLPQGVAEVIPEGADAAGKSGLLHDSIVQFLSKRERSEIDGIVEPAPSSEQTSKHQAKPRIKRSKSNRESNNGRKQVVELFHNQSFAAQHSAREFKTGHLYGNRIRRDASMLRNLARAS